MDLARFLRPWVPSDGVFHGVCVGTGNPGHHESIHTQTAFGCSKHVLRTSPGRERLELPEILQTKDSTAVETRSPACGLRRF